MKLRFVSPSAWYIGWHTVKRYIYIYMACDVVWDSLYEFKTSEKLFFIPYNKYIYIYSFQYHDQIQLVLNAIFQPFGHNHPVIIFLWWWYYYYDIYFICIDIQSYTRIFMCVMYMCIFISIACVQKKLRNCIFISTIQCLVDKMTFNFKV